MTKETLYIEADDEITTVIDKVISSKDAIVAVVLPKRSTVFQSAVNVKLLKRAAKEAKKNIVLITSEPAIEAIAAVSGVHVAKTLNSKPVIPKKLTKATSETTITHRELDGTTTAANKSEQLNDDTVGEKNIAADEEPIEIDNTDKKQLRVLSDEPAISGKTSKIKRFKIPDFGAFRIKMFLAGTIVVLLIVGWVYGFVILPRAVVTITTNTSREPVSMNFTAKLGDETADYEKALIPAKKAEVTKENTATVPATGEKNIGEFAVGKVTVTNCGTSSFAVTEGMSFSAGSVSFVAAEAATVPKSTYDPIVGGFECQENGKKTVNVVAASPGASFNVDDQSYTVQGSPSKVTAFGSTMTGGTDQMVKVVSEEDIKKARNQLAGSAKAAALTELKALLSEQQMQSLEETIEESAPVEKISKAAQAEAEDVTVTQTVKFSMLGVASSDLGSLLDAKIAEQLKDKEAKNVRSNGLDSATLRVTQKVSADEQVLSVQTVAVLGPEFDESAIKQDAVGKKRGDIQKSLETREGVREVTVEYKPFWVTTTPRSTEKIEIVINEVEN